MGLKQCYECIIVTHEASERTSAAIANLPKLEQFLRGNESDQLQFFTSSPPDAWLNNMTNTRGQQDFFMR